MRPVGKFAVKTTASMNKGEYILNDESVVNSHGFVLLNAAGRFERFNANPVMLFNHEADKLIGQMTGLRVEGTKLIGTPVYDEEDALAAKCKRQGEKGFLKGCSPGIMIYAVELRTNPDGEERITITDWELCEVSLVSVPSNRNALRLYNAQGEAIPDDQIRLSIESLLNINKMDKIILTAEAYAALGLKSAEADGKAISAAIMELKARTEKAEKELEKQRKTQAEALVDLAIREGRITADKKEQFVKLALTDFEMAKTTLEAIPEKETLSGKVTHSTGKAFATKDRAEWTYLKWAKEDPEGLKRLKETDPEAFEELKKRIK